MGESDTREMEQKGPDANIAGLLDAFDAPTRTYEGSRESSGWTGGTPRGRRAGSERPGRLLPTQRRRQARASERAEERRAAILLVVLTGALSCRSRTPTSSATTTSITSTDNPNVLRGLHPGGATAGRSIFDAGNWHPLTWLSHMLDASLFGLRAGGAPPGERRVARGPPRCCCSSSRALTGALWPELLRRGALRGPPAARRVRGLGRGAQGRPLRAVRDADAAVLPAVPEKTGGRAATWVVAAVFALGLMAKPMLVTLPFALLLLDWWPLGRFGSRRRDRRTPVPPVGAPPREDPAAGSGGRFQRPHLSRPAAGRRHDGLRASSRLRCGSPTPWSLT